ncbi:MAG: ATP-dependent DNA helicase [bacterium]|nr:ATP-dependent DNA helicase [bacterium]
MPEMDPPAWPVLPEDLLCLPGDPAPQIPILTAEEVFGPGGLLAQKLPGFVLRDSQLTMAREVDSALAEGRSLLIEAPCGVGKSISYSVPAIQHALATGQRVLIATANIALQEQLTQKDLPFLQGVLPEPFRFSLLKGRSNFICTDKLLEQRSMLFAGVAGEDQVEFDRVLDWANQTTTGDAGELPFKVTPRIWRHFAIGDTSECAGCKLQCYHKAAMADAEDAQVVVCNYHLLFAHLKVKAATGGMAGVLPAFNVLICDEAHELPDIGSDFAGEEIGRWSFRGFKRHLSRAGYDALDQAAHILSHAIKIMGFKHGAEGSNRIKEPGLIDDGPILDALRLVFQELRALQVQYEKESKEHAQLERQKEQCAQLAKRVQGLIWQKQPEWVYWVERQEGASGESWKLRGKPVSIAPFLQKALLPWVPCVIATSATLTTSHGDFTFIRERIGLGAGTRQVVLPSPFDFNSSALLVVPHGLPEPNDKEFRDQVHDLLHEAVLASRGRALLLFTSSQALRGAHTLLAPAFERAGFACHRQGDAPSTRLIQRFREDVSSVLFATRTFFQGVDVPGEALSLVALDRLPFPSPADPVMDYIAEHDPKGWFRQHSLPTALVTWRQIFGRLIRRHDDRGVVLLLDGRVGTKKYGKQFLKAIPGGMLSREVAAIGSFLADPEDPFA